MKHLAWLARRRGTVLALGAGTVLIAAALLLHGLAVRPLERRVLALQAQRQAPRDGMLERLGDDLARQDSPRAQLDSFYAYFERDEALTDRLARVHTIARSLGIEIKRADYRLSSQPQRRLDRYQMSVPIQASYPTLRAFVTTVLRELPTLSLEQIQLQRKDVADGAVEAQVSFTFYLARP